MARKLSTEKREVFLSTALRLFVARGVQNTSTAEIAKEAGTAAGTLFLYFPTKQELIHELVLKIAREQSEAIRSLLKPSLTVREIFFTIWDGSLRWFMDHMDAYRYVQQVRDSGMIAESVVQETSEYLSYYYEAIQKGWREGSIKPYPAELIGGFLYQNVVAVMNLIRMQPDSDQQVTYIRLGFEIFWNGIRMESVERKPELS
jgi:AcrR family transcriptional regulator